MRPSAFEEWKKDEMEERKIVSAIPTSKKVSQADVSDGTPTFARIERTRRVSRNVRRPVPSAKPMRYPMLEPYSENSHLHLLNSVSTISGPVVRQMGKFIGGNCRWDVRRAGPAYGGD
jgi:hypothetical protein